MDITLANQERAHYGLEQPDAGKSKITLSHELGGLVSEQASERMSAAERVSAASSAE